MNRVSVRALLCVAVLTLNGTGASSAASRIDHEAECTYKKVTWEDFRGPVVNGQQQAWIATIFVVEPVRVEVTLDEGGAGAIARARNPVVYALMNKLESGARPGGRNDRNLAHEQIHFDLTEYVARRLSRELSVLTVEGPAANEELRRNFLLAAEKRYSEAVADQQTAPDAVRKRDVARGTGRRAEALGEEGCGAARE